MSSNSPKVPSTTAVIDFAYPRIIANLSVETKIEGEEEEEGSPLSPDAELDIEIGVAEIVPIIRAPAPRMFTRRAEMVLAVSERNPNLKETEWFAVRPATPHPIHPTPAMGTETPPPLPVQSPRRSTTPSPLPERSQNRIALRSAVEQQVIVAIVAPVARHVSERAEWITEPGPVDFSEQGFSSEDEDDEEAGQNTINEAFERMHWMHEEWLAGRLTSSPSSISNESEEYDSDSGRASRNSLAAEIFDLTEDGVRFRNPFEENRVREMSEEDAAMQGIEEVLSMVGIAEYVARPSTGLAERALNENDESILGYSPNISPNDTDGPPPHSVKDELDYPSRHLGGYDSDVETEDSKQDIIVNPMGEQLTLITGGWTVWCADTNTRRASLTSDYSSPSRPGSPVLLNGEALLYTPIDNPWHAGESMKCVSEIEAVLDEQLFVDAAKEFFASFEVEALIAESKMPCFELEDTDTLKGEASYYKFGPHVLSAACHCYWCRTYYESGFEEFARSEKHDSNDWCHCMNCKLFRDEEERKKIAAEEKQKRDEQDKIWKARIAKLAADIQIARAEEESALLDLTDFKVEEDEDFFKPKPKPIQKMSDWFRSRLRNRSE